MNIFIREDSALIDPYCESSKSFTVSLCLALCLGLLGGHRFYLGRYGSGVLQLLSFGGLGVWLLFDLFNLKNGQLVDSRGRRICHRSAPSRDTALRVLN